MLDGLRWLARHQGEDGSWNASKLKDRCQPESPCYDTHATYLEPYDEGLTGLALSCFLEAGFSHESEQDIVDTALAKRHKIGDIVKNGLQWLIKRQNPDGSFTRDRAFMYNEALCTLALVEAYGLTGNRYWKEPAQKAVDFVQKAQRPDPSGHGLWGWRYESRMEVEISRRSTGPDPSFQRELVDSDTSITSWCARSLAAARDVGLNVRPESLEGALKFIEWVSTENGLAGYIDPGGAGATVTGHNDQFIYHPATISALAMIARMAARPGIDDPWLELAANQIVRDLPSVSQDKLSIDYYYWHQATRALNQLDGHDTPWSSGKYWGPWKKAMVDAVLSLQDHKEHACTNGGWIVPDRWAYTGGPIYTTAINVLTLESDYRYERQFPNQTLESLRALVGKPAPDFTVRDLHGKDVSLSSLRHRVVLLDFWWPDSLHEPDVELREDLLLRLTGKPFVFLGIGTGNTEISPPYVQAARARSPGWIAASSVASKSHPVTAYDLHSFPALFLVDAQGVVRAVERKIEDILPALDAAVDEAQTANPPK